MVPVLPVVLGWWLPWHRPSVEELKREGGARFMAMYWRRPVAIVMAGQHTVSRVSTGCAIPG
jgi:hypothetical protein